MKRLIYILALVVAPFCYAQENAPQLDLPCIQMWWYPYYYCECQQTSIPFQFPLEVQVTDTMWFKTTIDNIRDGMSAYWFADCSMRIEVYAFCSSEVPTVAMTVGRNQMHEMSIEEINSKLDQMGDQAAMLGQVLTPRVRLYPIDGGTGNIYCYPYDQGPKSTCDSILPVVAGMTYVCDQPEEVYELIPSRIPANGQGFIRWKQKRNLPGTIRLTTDSCNGPEIANVTLADSLRVFVLDAPLMQSLKQADRNV